MSSRAEVVGRFEHFPRAYLKNPTEYPMSTSEPESAGSGPSAAQQGSVRRTLREVLAADLAKDPSIIGGKVGAKVYDLMTPVAIAEGVKVKPVRASDDDGLRLVRHSTAHVMADAVQRLFPGTKVTFGPATENGFYYDFDKPNGPFTDDDLVRIEDEMRRIVKDAAPFEREVIERDAAKQLFTSMGENYKAEHVERLPEGAEISLYRHSGDGQNWVDLCEGPHIPNTKFIGAIKLTSVAGAYWRGDERNPMLQRVYGTSFPTQKALDAYLKLLEEAKARDHRKLGKELELFMFHEYAPAMPFLLPRGAVVYNGLVEYMRKLYLDYGYEEVITPQIFDKKLFETSGHLQNYRENMYLPVTADQLDQAKLALSVDVPGKRGDSDAYIETDRARDKAVVQQLTDLEKLAQKPMNCPSHCLIFGQRRRSYRELPWRVADFGRLHRYERGGVVHGLARVRSFCQDDAHIFCTTDQIHQEISSFLGLLAEVYGAFKFTKIDIKLATRPEKRIGDDAMWDAAESALAKALDDAGHSYEIAEGEGAFYGPKLEFHIHDALQRSWQLGTIQVDYSMPERFDLDYTGSDGAAHRPVMLHRAILGSLERFLSLYIEHTAGAFPVWLAPEQAIVVTVTDAQNDYADEIVTLMTKRGLRVKAITGSDKLGAKIRTARLLRVPYVLVVGDKEVAERRVAPRSRDENKDLGPMGLDEFTERLVSEALPPRLRSSS